MRDVVRNGQGAGVIAMDSLAEPGLYGVGPLAHLRGEITVVDGVCLVARMVDGQVRVAQEPDVQAPFFVHALVRDWEELVLPGPVVDLAGLDAFLSARALDHPGPFAFRLTGIADSVLAHVLDVPEGVRVSSREEAHAYDARITLCGEVVELVGFFSTTHRTVFTHHDSNIHVHALSADRQRMGHADSAHWRPGAMRLVTGR